MVSKIFPVYTTLFGNSPVFLTLAPKLREAGIEIKDLPVENNLLKDIEERNIQVVPTVSFFQDGKTRHLNITGLRKTVDISSPSCPGQIKTIDQALAYTSSFLDANGAVYESEKKVQKELALYETFNGDGENRKGVIVLANNNGVDFHIKLLLTLEDKRLEAIPTVEQPKF